MIKNNYLSLSEIILGLREEYINTCNELNALKQQLVLEDGVNAALGIYSVMNVPNVEDTNSKSNVYYLIINLEKKRSKLESIINYVTRKNFKLDKVIYNVNDIRKNFVSVNDERLFEVTDFRKFRNDANKVLLSSFNTGLKDKYKTVNEEGLKVKIGHNGVCAITDLQSKTKPIIGVDYYAADDQLVMNNYYGDTLFCEKAKEILNTFVPVDSIDSRLVSIIQSNPISEYPIKFDGLTNDRNEQRFNLEVNNGYVLARNIKKM